MLRNARWWRCWPKVFLTLVQKRGTFGRRLVRLAESVGCGDPARRMALLLTVETLQNPPESLFTQERQEHLASTTDPFRAYHQAAERFRGVEPVQQMMLTDLTLQVPSQFLTKVDRATMAAGIEARVPMLDEQVVRLALKLPSKWKVNGLQKKIVLRNSQRGRIPNEILDGPKTGFGVPYNNWIRTSLYEFTRGHLLDVNFLNRFMLQEKHIENLLQQHKQRKMDHSFLLWKLLQLAIWKTPNYK